MKRRKFLSSVLASLAALTALVLPWTVMPAVKWRWMMCEEPTLNENGCCNGFIRHGWIMSDDGNNVALGTQDFWAKTIMQHDRKSHTVEECHSTLSPDQCFLAFFVSFRAK